MRIIAILSAITAVPISLLGCAQAQPYYELHPFQGLRVTVHCPLPFRVAACRPGAEVVGW